MALDPPMTSNTPNRSKTTIIGTSQNFLRCFINCHKSLKNSIIYFLIVVVFLAFQDKEYRQS